MKQNINFDANKTNLLKIWQFQTQRMSHIRRLNTIYRDKSYTFKNHAFQEHENRNYMALHLKNKEKDMQRRQRSFQHQIDYENQILRNKLIDASLTKHKPKMPSFQERDYSIGKDEKIIDQSRKSQKYKSESYFKKQQKTKIVEENAKLFVKLASIKSDIIEKLNIKTHQKKVDQMKERLQKRSPKKMKMLQSYFRKGNLDIAEYLAPIGVKPHTKHEDFFEDQEDLN